MKCNFNINRLSGKVSPPGDKSISHRALILAALAKGTSEIVGLSNGQDVLNTKNAILQMGARELGSDSAKVHISGGNLTEPQKPIYLGNSGTGIRLLAGVCAGQDFASVLDGDKSIRTRPMDRVIDPLTQMGAEIKSNEKYAPLRIAGGKLNGIDYELPIASAQVKSAVLLAGLFASGKTRVKEKIQTRMHTEEMLKEFGADIDVDEKNLTTTVKKSELTAQKINVATDPSAAAFWVVAASILKGSDIVIPNVYLGTGRDGFINVLKRMGADISLIQAGKNVYDLEIKSTELSGTDIQPDEIPSLIDEIPILCVAAAHAKGQTKFQEVGELRFKESNRMESVKKAFDALGGNLEIVGDEMCIKGTGGFLGGKINSVGDHRIAMSFAIASLTASGSIHISGFKKSVATSYPNFLIDLKSIAQ